MTYKEDLEEELDVAEKALYDCLQQISRFVNRIYIERRKNRHSWPMEGLFETSQHLGRAYDALNDLKKSIKEEDYV